MALIFIFCDAGYISYFNSFFYEPASYIFLFAFLALWLDLIASGGRDPKKLALCGASVLLFVAAKPQNVAAGVILALYFWRFSSLVRPRWTAWVASAAILIVSLAVYAAMPRINKTATVFNMLFLHVLPQSPDPAAELRSLHLDPVYARYSGFSAFTPDTPFLDPAARDQVSEHVNHFTIVWFYLSHPAQLLDYLRWVLPRGTSLRAENSGVMRNVEGTQAPYFVDMVKDQLLAQFSEHDLLSQSYRIYTTLDLDVQEAASAAVNAGSVEVDKRLKKSKAAKDAPPPDPLQPQMALVVLDPHTGWLKALVGGRDYGRSQLNHVLAKRQPGSSFKPFVYAAALNSGVDGSQPLITPATVLNDEPTTFQFGDLTYEPENYKQEYFGQVTLRQALTHSLNVATVSLAEMVGYEKVRNLAVAAGFNKDLLATPAIALGSYVATPLEVAGAYTIFSNGGTYVEPRFILAVNDASGRLLWRSPEVTRQVLDPRVAYLMVNLLESVINNGTGAGARSRGFTLPAAGKTGTSHDGWFAGFTSNLLAVAWVGYDDDRRTEPPRGGFRPAHLDGVHEARHPVPRLSGRQAL